MKLTQLLLIVLVLLLGGLVLYGTTVGKDRSEVLAVSALGAKVWSKVLSGLGSLRGKEGTPAPKLEDSDLQAALKEALDAMFLEQSGFHFSRSVWGAETVPYQFRGLRVGEPHDLPANPADRPRGIDRRVFFPVAVEAFRRYDSPKGWGLWEYAGVPRLDGVTFVRVEGRWRPSSRPDRDYSVR